MATLKDRWQQRLTSWVGDPRVASMLAHPRTVRLATRLVELSGDLQERGTRLGLGRAFAQLAARTASWRVPPVSRRPR